jgi:hypothetical protein
MACLISQGREEQCKESIGGLQAVYFMNYELVLSIRCRWTE